MMMTEDVGGSGQRHAAGNLVDTRPVPVGSTSVCSLSVETYGAPGYLRIRYLFWARDDLRPPRLDLRPVRFAYN